MQCQYLYVEINFFKVNVTYSRFKHSGLYWCDVCPMPLPMYEMKIEETKVLMTLS